MLNLSEYLTEMEKNQLEMLNENPILLEAIKKVVLSCVYFDGTIKPTGIPDPQKNFLLAIAGGSMGQLSREQLGEKVEASLAGVQLLEVGFKELAKFKKIDNSPIKKTNPGR